MNIMLIDADGDNIKNFRTYIRNAYPDCRVVGGFSDPGKDVLAAVGEWKPDLIIADIKFFGGARYLRFKDIHEAHPELRFVVYGTYNESDYMKRAREFGVLDFMYRPVKPADLSRCMDQAVAYFKKADVRRQEVKMLTHDYQERLFQYEDIFLRALAEGHIRNTHEIENGFAYFNIPFDKGFSVCVLRIDHYKKVALTLLEMEKHLLIFKILNIVREKLRDYNAQAFIMAFHAVVVILNGHHSIEDKVWLCDELKHAVHEQTDTRVTVGIGRTYDSAADIAVSYREADAAFRYRCRMGYHAVIPIEFVEPENKITYRYPHEREERLIYAAVAGDYEYARQLLSEIFDALAQCGPLPEGLVAKIAMNIVIRISRYISEQNLPIAQQVTRFFPTTELLKLTGLEDGLLYMEEALKQFCAFVTAYNESTYGTLHEHAKQYVQAHYFESYSVAKIALHLNTSPELLNRVFMEREQVMLFDYVMWVRVYHAQTLLRETELDEEAVAVKVGFDDAKYFRSMFKKYNGETPAEYRARAKAV